MFAVLLEYNVVLKNLAFIIKEILNRMIPENSRAMQVPFNIWRITFKYTLNRTYFFFFEETKKWNIQSTKFYRFDITPIITKMIM